MNNYKKISIFIPSFEKGGVERNVLIVSKIFLNNGYIVDLVYTRNDIELFSQLDERVNKVKIKRYFNFSFIHPRIMDSINILFGYFKYLFINKKDIIVLSFQSNIVAILLGKLLNIPVIARVASHPNVINIEKSLVIKFSQKLKNLFYRFATLIITNSEVTSKEICRLTNAKVKTIYNPSYNDTVIEKSKEVINDDVFNSIKNKKIISVGRLSFEKDLSTLIEAFNIVQKKIDCTLVFIGEGDQKTTLEKKILDLNLTDKVYFLGFKSNPYKYMKNSDLFVLASLYEGLPNVIIESLAVDTPVVSTDCLSGPREILMDGKGGDLVEVGNINELACAIIRNLESSEYSIKKLMYARKYLDRFSLDSISQKYLDLINRIIR